MVNILHQDFSCEYLGILGPVRSLYSDYGGGVIVELLHPFNSSDGIFRDMNGYACVEKKP